MPVDEVWEEYVARRTEESRNRVVVHYAPLVKYVVGRIQGRLPAEVDEQDLISEGVIGLIQAVEGFRPERGHAFPTYAVPRIKGAILDSLREADRLPRHVRSRVKELEAARTHLHGTLGRAPTRVELADVLQLPVESIDQLERADRAGRTASLDELEWADEVLQDAFAENADPEPNEVLLAAVGRLPERSQIIVSLYYLERLTLAEIGQVLGVTESRVSQLRSGILSTLQGQLA